MGNSGVGEGFTGQRRDAPTLTDKESFQEFPFLSPNGRIDQKRDDAIAMLQKIQTLLAAEPSPKLITYNFQHTDMWETVVRLEACS